MSRDTDTKTKILQSAKTLFVENGYAGTSIGKIAKLADINHSLIFHHFGNKTNLWIAVKQYIAEQAENSQIILPKTDTRFETFIVQLLHNSYTFYKNNPDIVQMLNWQRIEPNDNEAIGITNSAKMQQWADAIAHYQQNGEIAKKHQPEWIVTMLLSLSSTAALEPNIFIKTKEDLEAYFQMCAHCLAQGLQ